MYRDAHDKCPRCGVDLLDARAARGCPNCRGLWIELGSLAAMVRDMVEVYVPIALPFEPHDRQPLPCPHCSAPMATWRLFRVDVDRCEHHGVWFDPDELAQVLLAVWVRSTSA